MDAERGPLDRVKVNEPDQAQDNNNMDHHDDSKGISISKAILNGAVNLETAQLKTSDNKLFSIKEAYSLGLLEEKEDDGARGDGLSLYDALCQGIIDGQTATVFNRITGEKCSIPNALKFGLLKGNITEIVDPIADVKITTNEALEKGILKNGHYYDSFTNEKLTLPHAVDRNLIIKPLTLKDCVDLDLIDDDGQIKSATGRSKASILESIAHGILDYNLTKNIVDTRSDELLSLEDALKENIILPNGLYKDLKNNEMIPIKKAVEQGLITSCSIKSLFDIDGFKDTETDQFLSFNQAIKRGILVNGEYVIDKDSGKSIPLNEAVSKGLVRPEILEMLSQKIGMFSGNKELSVLGAVMKGYLDPESGLLIDQKTKKLIPLEEAMRKKLISQEGASLLHSLLNINLTTQTVTKTVFQHDTTVLEDPLTFDLAKSFGLVDEDNKIFTCLTSGVKMPFLIAVEKGFLTDFPSDVDLSRKPSVKDTLIKTLDAFVPKDSTEGHSRPSSSSRESSLESSPKKAKTDHTEQRKSIEKEILERQVFELPPDGWFLSEAIDRKLFDPVTGLFIISGTDRLVSFEECIIFEIINSKSAVVLDPSKKRHISITRALEKKVLDSTGHFTIDSKRITLKEAIENNYVLLETRMELDENIPRLIKVTKVEGKPDIVEVSEIGADPNSFKEIKFSDSEFSLEPLQVSPGVIFDPATALVIFMNSSKSSNLFDVIKDRSINIGKVKVKDPHSGQHLSVEEAIERGIVDKDTGIYNDTSGRQIDFNNAVKFGVISVDGTPLVAVSNLKDVIEETLVEMKSMVHTPSKSPEYTESELVPSQLSNGGDGLPLDELTRSCVTIEPIDNISSVTDKDMIPNENSQGKPVILHKMRRKVIEPRDAARVGILTDEMAEKLEYGDTFKNTKGETLTLGEAVNLGKIDGTVDCMTDPQRGDTLSITEAINRGYFDPREAHGKLLIPIARSLSVPELVKQGLIKNGKVVHPENGALLNLKEAIVCDIVDPLSNVIDHKTGASTSLTSAIEHRIIDDESSKVISNSGALELLPAVLKGDIFENKETPDIIGMQLVGMTLNVVLDRKLIDPETKTIVHPITGEKEPIKTAIDNDFIMAVPTYESPDGVNVVEAFGLNLIDCEKQTFKNPKTGESMKVYDAIDNGLLIIKETKDSFEKEGIRLVGSDPEECKPMNILDAYELLYDNKSNKFRDPQNPEKLLSIKAAMNTGIIDPNSVLFDAVTGESYTTKEAIDKGLIDVKSGRIKSKDKDGMSISEAAKLGLLAVIGAPVLAGRAVVNAIKSIDKSDNVSRKSKSTTASNSLSELSRNYSLETDPLPRRNIVHVQVCDEIPPRGEEPAEENHIDPNITSIESFKGKVTDTNKNKSKNAIAISKTITPRDFVLRNLYDPNSKSFLDPHTGESIPFYELVSMGILDPNILVKNLNEKNDFVTLNEALELNLIDSGDGFILDPNTGKEVTFFEAIKLGWIKQPELDSKSSRRSSMTFEEALDNDLFDVKTCEVIDPNTQRRISFSEAVLSGLLNPESISIRKSSNEDFHSLPKAVELGILDLNRSLINDTVDIPSAFQKGFILPRPRKPVSLVHIVKQKLYTPKSGFINDRVTKTAIPLQESINRFIVDPFITHVKDLENNKYISLEEAISNNIIDAQRGKYVNKVDKSEMTLDKAVSKELIVTEPIVVTLIEALVQGFYNNRSGSFFNPILGEEQTLENCIISGFIDVSSVLIKDAHQDEMISVKEAEIKKIIDLKQGTLLYPRQMTLDVALEKGFILSSKKPWSLQEALMHKIYDSKTGLLTLSNGRTVNLEEAIALEEINKTALSVKDPRSGDIMTLADAIKMGIIDPKANTATNPLTGEELNLNEALEQGLLLPAKRKLSFPEAVSKGFYDPLSGKFSSSHTREKLPTDKAMRHGFIDAASTIVKADGNLYTFEHAVEEGIVDVKHGNVRLGGKSIDFQQALEQGIIIEVRRPLSIAEAISKGLYDKSSGLFLDPWNEAYYTLSQAIENHLIDPSSVNVKDTRCEAWKRVSLVEALKLGIVNGDTGILIDVTNGKELSILEAFESGLISDSKEAISLQKALHLGLYDDETGKITDLQTSSRMSLHGAIERSFINPTLPCFWNKEDGKLLSLLETCRAGIIDKRSGMFKEPGANFSVTLSDALQLGLIVDIENGSFGLYEAISMGLCDDNEVTNPATGEKVTLKIAVNEDLINPHLSIIKDNQKNIFIKLPQAVDSHVIDDELGTYKCKNSGETLSLVEAKEKGFIITAKRPLSIEEALQQGLYNEKTGRFIDPESNTELNLKQACVTNLITTETIVIKNPYNSQVKPYATAVEEGLIDAENGKILNPNDSKSYTIAEAFKEGILSAVAVPVIFEKAMRRKSDVNKSILKHASSLTIGEALSLQLIDPDMAVVKDLNSGKFKPFKKALSEGLVDLNKKADLNLKNGNIIPQNIIIDQNYVLYLQEPLSFSDAISNGYLNTKSAQFTDPTSGKIFTLKEAVNYGLVDPDSAIVKETAAQKMLKLPEAYKRGLMDTEKSNVLDTSSSRLYNLQEALDLGLITTRSVSLLETLDYGLYNPTTGAITDPFSSGSVTEKRRLNLEDAINVKLVEPLTTVIKNPLDGKISSIDVAVSSQLLDTKAGRFVDPTTKQPIDLIKARDRGYILPSSARQAIEEKYRSTDDQLTQLLDWVGEIEDRLANQDVAQEDLELLRNQINFLKLLKEEIDSQSRPVTTCLDQLKQLVATGAEFLSRDEITSIEKKGKQLRTRYDRVNVETERLVRQLTAARDELSKFRMELGTFTNWMEHARRNLDEKERMLSNLQRIDSSNDSIKELVSDIIAHQADLRFITMAAQKFFDESKEYLNNLNNLRATLPARLSHLESPKDSVVRSVVNELTAQYKDLLNRANALSDRLSGVGGRQREFKDALEKARSWMREAEPRASKVISEPLAADPTSLQDQLQRTKAVNNDFIVNGHLIDNAKTAVDALLRSLQGQISPSEVSSLKGSVKELEDKYKSLCDMLAEKCKLLDQALAQSQGVQDALDQLAHWLSDAENQLKNITRPAALVKERLEEQMREQRVFQADLDSHRSSVDSVAHSAQEIIHNASNPRLAKKIETKLRDVTSRFEKLLDKCAKRGEFLTEIHNSLTSFNGQASSVERWLNDVLAAVQLPDVKIDDIAAQRDSQRDSLEQTLRNGRNLIAKKDVTETGAVRDRVKTLENLWKELNLHLDEKQRLGKQRTEQLVAYEKLRDQVIVWLNTFENRVEKLEPIAVDIEIVKKQAEQIKPLIKEHRDYAMTIDKLNDLGSVYDALTRPDVPGKRRSSSVINPPKKVSLANVSLRRTSQDIGGYSSRRASQDFGEDLSPIQQELGEINHRYSVLGSKLNDRHNELELTRDELRKLTDHLKTLSQFLDKIHRALPKESVPHTKEEADKTVKIIKNIIEDMYEKQSMLDSTKSGIKDLLRKKPNALGADQLANELENVCSRWKSIADGCKNRIQFLEDVKEFYDTHDNLNNWLNAKDRMMTVLGPISSDPRMVQSQVQQVQVLREEFRTQQPQLHHLTSKGESVLARIGDPNSPDSKNVEAKLKTILEKWADLLGKLDERAASLGAAADTAREFDAALTRLKDNLQNISDQLDDIPLDKEPEEQLRKLQNLERQLEGQRPLLADLEAAGGSLCDVLSDPASKAEIQAKLSAINRQYNNLQKKLDHKKAELEGLLKDGRQFEASCAQTLGWLSEGLGALSERLLVSADREILQQQLDHHEPIYKDVLSKEHEVIMLLNKGRELLARNSYQQQRNETRSQQRDLDKIQQHWDKLRKDVSERHTRLQTCMEHCKKYYRALETFLPWLTQAENKMDQLRPESFKRRDIERQLRELSAFRNDVWKHSGEYENLKHLGETFLLSCDVDKEIVKQELADVKTRWDKLNNDLHAKTQWLEDMSRRLGDFSENLRDLGHNVQRCEDKLQSHDSLGGAGRDPKLLDRIKTLREDVAALKKPLGALRQTANDLVAEGSEAGVGDATHLRDDVDGLGERIEELASKLDDRCAQLQSASTALTQYNDQVKALSTDLAALEHELDNMKPPGRDVKTVRSQQDDLSKFIKKLVRTADDVANAVMAGERLVDSGFAPDTVATREQAESLNRQLNKLDEKARNREDELEKILEKLNAFQQAHTRVLEDINQASEDLRRLKPVGSEVEAIKSQKDEFAALKRQIEPLGQSVDACNKTGQGLVQSAAAGVNTSLLEKDLEKLNDKWNALKEKLNERSRKLDIGLLQSGKFQEALDSFAKWLTDTEEMVANQKPPSADYKVVKAQLQEQKFLKKMLADRQHSMSSLFQMGNEVAANADPAERKAIERQLNELMTRFDNLNEGASQRMDALEQAMAVAKQFQDKLTGILDWLDKSEKKIKDMELIPTDEEKIQQRIREHDALHKEILRKKPDFTELTDIASSLMGLVGEDEAAVVADKLQDTADRYGALVEASDNLGQLLQASKAGLRHLVLTYQDLQAWMENMEARLNRYRILPVHTEKLIAQMEDLADLTEEIANKQNEVDGTVDSGFELMKHISSDEAIQLKDKLDSLQRRYNELTARGADMLKHAQEALPLVQQFHNSHHRLVDWMLGAEATLQAAEPREEDISRLEADIQEFRPVLENINLIGPQLCQISPGEGASTIEGLVTRDNRRFDAIVEQIQRKAERIHLSKQRSLEVISDIDELLDWFREVESNLREAEPPSSEPDVIRVQLKEHKALNDDISSQKTRVRDVLSTAKKVLRESPQHEDTSVIREKMEDLRESMETVSGLSSDRLGILEQALPLAEHFHGTHGDLSSWMNDMERQVSHLALPALRPDLIAQQQDKNEQLLQSIAEHKPLVDKLNKTGEALIKLTNDEEGAKVQEIMDTDNARYNALKVELRQRQQALEKALQESSQFSDKLEGMLRALANTADQVAGAEPISAHPPKIHDQIDDNNAMVEDLDKREEAFQAVKKAANDVINKAPNSSDPAVRDIKKKLERLNGLWNEVQKATNDRGRSLEEALALAEKFWKELQSVMATLRDLQDNLNSQEPPAVEPKAIQQQQYALKEIKAEIDQTKPEVEQCRASGQKLMKICGEPDKPEVKKHIEDLDSAWDTVTALFAKREENLIHAMEKAMEFHETLQDLLKFLERAEDRFAKLGPLGSDIDAVKKQIAQLKQFKADVDPHMVQVEALNRAIRRQAQELTERTSAEQAASLKEPLASVNRRWDDPLRAVVERQRQLENALLRLGQFQHALAELMAWIDNTNRTLDNELKPVAGDTQLLEIELAKLKVLMNDIQAHQNSVDTLNYAGRQLIESGKGSDEASSTQDKLNKLNKYWRDLLQKAADRQTELEEALKEAQRFSAEIQDLLSWLSEVDGVIAASKPVGGLPETASEQLERFMEVYNELEENRPKVETVLAQGQEYLKKSPGTASNLQQNLRTLKQRWDSVTARANDKKIKLEIALKEATEFHDSLQAFVDWLTNAEKTLSNLKPVSRVLPTILQQIEEHKAFQKDVGVHRETMLHLDKKGTHLKYFSQKQDVILIKNLLISVQHRWERVVAKSAERTRALDHGYKEAREFHDAWSALMSWLTDTDKSLDELAIETQSMGNDPDKIKQRLAKHRDFQRALSGKQGAYDSTMRCGKTLKDKAPKTDEPQLRQMMNELKEKWNTVCSKAVDRQRKLEEALLYCGQFKDALEALLDWLRKTEKILSEDTPVHGDLDTVMALVEQHKAFEGDLESRALQMESVKRTGKELEEKANATDAAAIRSQLNELTSLWSRVNKLTERKTSRLEEALKEAEQLHKAVHTLLEWLSDAEMKLRFVNSLPEDDQEARLQLAEHEKFLRELAEKEIEKDATIALAQRILVKSHPDGATVIKHWITIIQSRWEEVSSWAKQREDRLRNHLRSLQDLDSLLEELLEWLAKCESHLLNLEAEPLPDDIPSVEILIEQHKEFMEATSKRQHEVDSVCKARIQHPAPDRKQSGKRMSTPGLDREDSPELYDTSRKPSRASPSREKLTDNLPHYGPRFPPKGSKGSEPQFRNPRCRLLWDTWRNVWLLAWERQRRLQERLNYLIELEKVKNFSWDDWRKRFLRFMNHKKSRLTDLFRKMDKNNDGLIPREDFVDGIIKTKFETSKLEMGAVADMFDHDFNPGLIDWKEFIAALRPDWEEKQPNTESEKIHDEVKRLVQLCTCRQKFRVFQVGEGKYRFGDSQKLRLVRILRSTVMVRVGGGWVALDEFLVKNDPCRVEMLPMPNPYVPEEHDPWCPYGVNSSKGRTNIELREQFILAEGVSQTMSAFKPKSSPSPNQQRSLSVASNAGPITKVREKSSKSIPMGKTGVNRSAGTPDSLSDNESPSYSRTPLKKPSSVRTRSSIASGGSLPGSRNNSRPPSRTGSKPPSRHGSNLSLDSTDDGTPSRIPRRSTSSRSSTGTTTPHKLGVPSYNGNSASRSRSPSGYGTPKPNSIHRASSIPTLSGSGFRARTPSGSSTPVPSLASGTRLQRKSSGASDTLTGLSRKSTPTDPKAPFRL
uniref:Dystonin n=1 Tax=Cacopsylla melanoneura TaxID=428564 RepID=A0A8D9ALE4_9HEMI